MTRNPDTAAPAAASLAKAYTPAEVEPAILQRWNDSGAFHPDPTARHGDGSPYCIVIPPPNVTAALHMGHALNNTLQDILIRYHRMRGDNTEWMPGTDHAGIATQTVVEKRVLQEEGKRRTDFTREAFIAKIQAWKDEYERRITEQLKAMGCSCDWPRQRFTMDEVCAAAVREAFFRLFKDGLIYRGKRLVNWDPATQTALADDEVEMQEVDGQFYYLRYPLIGPPLADGANYVTVATTRPETMLGDTAVAINPRDPRAAELRGRRVLLPIVNREIPIIEDEYVTLPDADSDDAKARYSSGFLKVTPAHDPNDWELGQRHHDTIASVLDHGQVVINVLGPDGTISKDHGWPAAEWDPAQHPTNDAGFLLGKDRFEARKLVVRFFKDHQLLEEIKPYRHSVGHSYRSHVPIEPYLSDQWYVKVTDDRLAGAALRAMSPDQCTAPASPTPAPAASPASAGRAEGAPWEGGLRFFPSRYARTFQTWHENIRDWCISRQLWWGHRIPVWSRQMSLAEWSDWMEQEPAASDLSGGESAPVTVRLVYADGRAFTIAGNERSYESLLEIRDSGLGETSATWYVCPRTDEGIIPIKGKPVSFIGWLENNGFVQDPDVLDTWFSSALWPISTFGWPDPSRFPTEFPEGEAALNAWNPGNVLCTAREIITLWVSRMVMFNLYFRGCLPFTDVFIHAMIQDGQGQKMSKSLGNGVDPLDIIHSHGADAMRFTLASMTTQTQDVRMPVDVVCPHTGQPFEPKMITTSAGHKVAAPVQESPFAPGKKMVTSFGLSSGQAQPTADMPLARNTSPKFDYGRNFANKVWNAVRFALTSMEDGADTGGSAPSPPLPGGKSGNELHVAPPEVGERAGVRGRSTLDAGSDDNTADTLADRWILARLAATVRDATAAIEAYDFNTYAQTLYDFFWRDLCDWYIEAVKPTVRRQPRQRAILAACVDVSLRLMHPVMPFITERLWESLNRIAPQRGIEGVSIPAGELLVTAPWPRAEAGLIDAEALAAFEQLQQIISRLREVRATQKVPPRQTLPVSIKAPQPKADLVRANQSLIEALANVRVQEAGPQVAKPADAASGILGDVELYVHGVLDADAERQRLSKRLEEVQASLATLEKRLANKSYVDKAPAHLVQQTRDQLAAAQQEQANLQTQLNALNQ